MYCCPVETPGRISEPYHLPGYGGHVPSYRHRNGGTFGKLSRDALEDPCVAQAPCPVLAPPAPQGCMAPTPCEPRNPIGCEDIGCCDPVCCPPPNIVPKRRKPKCPEINCDPCKIMEFFPSHSPCGSPSKPCADLDAALGIKSPGGSGGCGGSGGYGGYGGYGGSGCGGGGNSPCPLPLPPNCGGPACGASRGSYHHHQQRSRNQQPEYTMRQHMMGDCCDDPCPPEPSCPPRKPVERFEQQYYNCGPPKIDCCDQRAHHLNRGPYACPCKPGSQSDNMVYRCCEPMSSSYAGHIPGFTFHSNGRTTGKATWGTKQYMNKCLYFNTFSKP